MDRFMEMQAFVAVVDAGSFVRGADALDLSKSVVSRVVSRAVAVRTALAAALKGS